MAGSSDFVDDFMEVQSTSGSYGVSIRSHSFQDSLRSLAGSAILADEFFAPTFAQSGIQATYIQATEENKSLNASPAIIEELRKSGANRRTELVAVGGGVIQDLSAFIASVYMRGLTWTYVPTTILAMVDSCIGGKSSINVGPYKNLVGTFHPPRQVLIDPALAETLPRDQRASGLIEAAKICFCKGIETFDRYMALNPSADMTTPSLDKVIRLSLESKKWFIEIDEFDKKERLLLNFGHTFGHAIEGATHFAIPHGIAVGLGILSALEFARASGTDFRDCPSIARLEQHLVDLISILPDISQLLNEMALEEMFERFTSDKKHGLESYTLILVDPSGKVGLRQIPKTPAVATAIQRAVSSVVERFQAYA